MEYVRKVDFAAIDRSGTNERLTQALLDQTSGATTCTINCIKTPPGIEPAALVKHMRETYGILIGTGLDKMRTTTLRVGHMGITASPLYILPTLSAIEMTLRELGYRSEAGAGVAAAQTIFADSAS